MALTTEDVVQFSSPFNISREIGSWYIISRIQERISEFLPPKRGRTTPTLVYSIQNSRIKHITLIVSGWYIDSISSRYSFRISEKPPLLDTRNLDYLKWEWKGGNIFGYVTIPFDTNYCRARIPPDVHAYTFSGDVIPVVLRVIPSPAITVSISQCSFKTQSLSCTWLTVEHICSPRRSCTKEWLHSVADGGQCLIRRGQWKRNREAMMAEKDFEETME